MIEIENPAGPGDTELAEIVAEIGLRLQRGEVVRPEDYGHHARTLRDLLPTLRIMADLPGAATPPDELGRLGDFRLVREVSRGGMGVVYEAVQVSLGRRVALKVLPNAAALDPRHLQRFQVEAQAAASLNHPHIVPVFTTGSAEGIPFYAMQFIDGRDLAWVIRDLRRDKLAETEADGREPSTPTPLSTPGTSHAREVARLARQAAEALDHAHGSDVLHRDIKPSNLMIDETGELWITDFGLARVRGGLDLTHTGDALGTPRYMCPEQALGSRAPLDGRMDIYSLGVTIYELLTLRPAFSGEDRLEILRQIAQDEPIPPRRLDPTIPADLETIVLKAMAKSPADRYTTAADLAADLGRFLENRPILARRPSLADRGAKWVRRHRALVVTATTGLVILIMGLAGAALQYAAWLRRHNAALQGEVDRADRYAAESQRHASEADRQRRLADRHFLAAQLRLARQAVEARQFEVAQDLLDEIAPDPGAGDPGEFAWHYLRRLARREIVRLPEHDASIHGMSMSRDGRTIVTFHKDPSSIVLWDLPSEHPRLRIAETGFTYGVPCLTGDGRILVARRACGPVQSGHDLGIWDATNGELRAVRKSGRFPLGKYVGPERSIHFLDSERLVAHVLVDESGMSSIRIWDLDFDSEKDRPRVALDAVDAFAFAPEGRLFATRKGSRITLHDVSSGAVVRGCPGEFDGDGPLALSRDGRLLVTASRSNGVVVRNVGNGEDRAQYNTKAPVVAMTFDPVGRTLVVVVDDGKVQLWDRSSGRVRVLIPDDLDRRRDVVHLGFSADGNLLTTTSHGDPGGQQPMLLWDVKSGRRLGTLPCGTHEAPGSHLFAPDGRSVIVNVGRAPRIWYFDPVPEPPSPAGHKDEAWAVAYSADGKILATGSDDTDEARTIKLWDPATGGLIRGWDGGDGTVASLAFSPDGRILASGHLGPRGNVRLWDVATGSLLHTLRGHEQMVRSVAFAPDGRTLATAGGKKGEASEDWKVRVWDVASARCVRELTDHTNTVRSLAYSPDGRTLATASNDQTVRLWDAKTGRLLQSQRGPVPLVAVTFAPDGETLTSADEAGAVTIRYAATLAVLRTIRGDGDSLLNLAYAPDGRSLATCGMSGVIRVWDALTGQELLFLKGHNSRVNGIAFAPDGLSLASCSHDGEVKLWRARSTQSR
jgi:WD40 repeat protein